MQKRNIVFLTVSQVFIFILLFLGGTGLFKPELEWVGTIIFGILAFFGFVVRKKISFPQGSLIFLVFIVLLGLNVYFKPTHVGENYAMEYLLLFISGGFLWLFSYTFRDKLTSFFENSVILLGLIFGGLFFLNMLFLKVGVGANIKWSLFFPYTSYHNHIGDIWAIVMLVFASRLGKGRKFFYTLPLILGVYFLFESLSRSAYLALGVGIFYLFFRKEIKNKIIVWGTVIVVSLLVVLTGFFKTTVFSRPYFVEAALGFLKKPWGVGMGNFLKLSTVSSSEIFRENISSNFTHNLLLEVLVGMGVWGIIFLAWILWSTFSIVEKKGTFVSAAIFLAIFVNFFFDTTYFVPTMVWLWFISLGIIQGKNNKPKLLRKNINKYISMILRKV